jgi:hypothetical protein
VDSPPPELGEHSIEILREIGVDDAEIERLLAAGIIKSPGAVGPRGCASSDQV